MLATKLFAPMGSGPGGRGLSRRAVFEQIDASLQRLGTDYVDLYQIHRFDPETPAEETMEALHDVVQAGKARYIGASSMWAWQFSKLQYAVELRGWTRFIPMQDQYNLVAREEEREMFPLLADQGAGSVPWSPLAAGLLARPWGEQGTTRGKLNPATDSSGTPLVLDSDRGTVDAVQAAARRASRACGELRQWLDGHPLSMRLVLPHLETADPKALLAGLQGTVRLPGWDDGNGGRLTSLPASLGYSYAHLDPAYQRRLAAICLFRDTADADVLAFFSASDGVPQRFRGVSRETWGEVLDAAAGAGLLTGLGGGMYWIHGLDSTGGALWLFFVGAQAQRQVNSGRLDTAESTYGEILAMLQAQPVTPQQQGHVAVTFYLLGRVEQTRGRMDQAAEWYARSPAISEELATGPGWR